MTDLSPFDHRPDPEVGAWLKDVLTVPDDRGFVVRVMARVPALMPRESWWDILSTWARPGLAAAAVLLMLAGFQLGRWVTAAPVADETGIASARVFDADTVLSSADVPQVDANLAMVYEYERKP